jgi:hypothetical protein
VTGLLQQIGERWGTDKATYHRYCDFYEDHLPGRDFTGTMLEIGIMDGASLGMWREYWPRATIIGVDNVVRARRSRLHNVATVLGDATDPEFVEWLAGHGPFDVILDDGSHLTGDQQVTFDLLWPLLAPGGRYIVEDLHTSHMANYRTSDLSTLEWMDASGQPWWVHGTPQGTPDQLIARCGFDPAGVTWTGHPDMAASLTALLVR